MIQLTRLNKQPLMVNSDLIMLVENAPDTVLTLITGDKIVVRETSEQVLELVVQFRQKVLIGAHWINPATMIHPPRDEGRSEPDE